MSKKNGVSLQVETFSPKRAAEELDAGRNVRKINSTHVRVLARAMKAGQWRLNGETIKYDRMGRLVDGQHRLAACVEAGVQFKSHVVRGLSDDDIAEIDTGRRRLVAQVLQGEGVSYPYDVAAAARMLFFHLHYGGLEKSQSSGNAAENCSTAEVRELLRQHPALVDSVVRVHGAKKIMPTSILALIHYLGSKHYPEYAECFVDDLITGENLKADNPAFRLRERMLAAHGARGVNMARMEIRALAVKAWNAYVLGEPVKILKMHKNEDFPTPIFEPLLKASK